MVGTGVTVSPLLLKCVEGEADRRRPVVRRAARIRRSFGLMVSACLSSRVYDGLTKDRSNFCTMDAIHSCRDEK